MELLRTSTFAIKAWQAIVTLFSLWSLGGAANTSSEGSTAFFNASLPSSIHIPKVLSLRQHISFSFRTCSHGILLYQNGGGGNTLRISLTEAGVLVMSWTASADGSVEARSEVRGVTFTNNEWYTVDIKLQMGVMHLSVEQGSVSIATVLVSNSTWRQYLWDLDLSGGGSLVVGEGFTGCMQSGLGVNLTATSTHNNIVMGSCPFSLLGSSCGLESADPCWNYPCLNGGSCSSSGSAYTCTCPFAYSGRNCGNDLGAQGCKLNPCQNGGVCESVQNGTRNYQCNCSAGYTGVRCEIDKDSCVSQPCLNQGICQDLVDGFSCNCTDTGFEGDNCQTNIDECSRHQPCVGTAVCSDNPGSYKCQCPAGQGGKNCDQMLNECDSNPCMYGGTCIDQDGYFECTCVPGYNGTNCEVDINECANVTCIGVHTECRDGINEYSCHCQPGYQDINSTATLQCVNIDECLSSPCQNEGTCSDSVLGYTCQCAFGFTGVHCETNIDECLNEPCSNGASCMDGIGSYSCQCVAGYTGPLCNSNIDDCESTPCQNGGTCIDQLQSFSCNCSAGWTGETCMVQVDECLSSPCAHGATCIDRVAGFACHCHAGYTGDTCSGNIDDCASHPCQHGGTCADGINSYVCGCTQDWMGPDCTQPYDACTLAPCQNGGTCTTTPPAHEYACNCSTGYSGVDCEVNIDDCVGNTCGSYEVCTDGINNYTCGCPLGYGGAACATEIQECASSPCQNGGTCVDGLGSYTCICPGKDVNLTQYTHDSRSVYRIGYAGLNCEEEVNECALRPSICLNRGVCAAVSNATWGFRCHCPQSEVAIVAGPYCELQGDHCDYVLLQVTDKPVCHNGGTCRDAGASTYTCQCQPGFNGTRCKTNIDECVDQPCLRGGTCIDGINQYTCNCPSGLTGMHCETDINECVSNPCLNGAVCVDQLNGYVCDCSHTGFTGPLCELDIDECSSNPCLHGGTCSDEINRFACSCHDGYTGTTCETDVDECALLPCQHGATCQQRSLQQSPNFSFSTAAGFICQCPLGYQGIYCEFDIDECITSPCLHGQCTDLVNGFICQCTPGYTGQTCDSEIDECAVLQNCTHGSTCVDLLADYQCICPATHQGVQYGGKNCDVQLVGCQGNLCENGATCMPTLDGSYHNYTCTCPPGYDGWHCEVQTTAGFSQNGYLLYSQTQGTSQVNMSLSFRTTISDGILVFNIHSTTSDYLLLLLVGGTELQLQYVNQQGSTTITLSTVQKAVLSDGTWNTVSMVVDAQSANLVLQHTDCDNGRCQESEQFRSDAISSLHTLGPTYFGGNGTSMNMLPAIQDQPAFIGCLQDIQVGAMTVYPAVHLGASETAHMSMGCARTDQCNPMPCNMHGNCQDLWWTYKCHCQRPFLGQRCQNSYIAATFGYGNQISYASFEIPPSEKDELKVKNNISFFFRTRSKSGILFFLGNPTTYITTRLVGGALQVQSKFDVNPQAFTVSGKFNDGLQHLFSCNRTNSDFVVQVDQGTLVHYKQTKYSWVLQPNQFYFGSLPQNVTLGNAVVGRRKRAITNSLTNNTEPFKGTIQDARQNGLILPIFPMNTTVPVSVYSPAVRQNVLEGEKTEDICNTTSPCQNNATCENVFFDNYACICTEGYRGKNCEQLDFCVYSQCPTNTTCQNRHDGFECISPATFNGATSMLRYSQSINDTRTGLLITASFRTRQSDGLLLHLRGTATYNINFITISINGSALSCLYNLGQNGEVISSGIDVMDGEWHNLTITTATGSVTMAVDDANVFTSATQQTVTLGDVLSNSNNIFVGAVDSTYASTYSSMFSPSHSAFKGCLEEIRIGDILLPFFSQSQMTNNTSAEQFHVNAIQDIVLGCHGDPVCATHQCMHGAPCRDIWNKYACDCVLGYNGTMCENNIDDCIGNLCENGAGCVDGIAAYSCVCVPGFTGHRCQTNIDECYTAPCENNGTCADHVNNYTCNCTEWFAGQNCEININDTCSVADLCNNGTCQDVNSTWGVMTFNCNCIPGYTGIYCESPIDYCGDSPCNNSATCTSNSDTLNYTCACAAGYTGVNCETEINECDSSPCQNGATCMDEVDSYVCNCTQGWEGSYCETNIDECSANSTALPCVNGKCVDTLGSFFCNCTATGYQGDSCEADINECDSTPCQHEGNCTNLNGTYTCDCTLGYYDLNCSTPNCSIGQCNNNSTCEITSDEKESSWNCSCLEFTSGEQCDVIEQCFYGPCNNGATCENTVDNYTCHCANGFKGENCTSDIDECLQNDTCKNGGICENLVGDYQCNCTAGYTKKDCSQDINECASNPCQYGGTCVDDVNGYTCSCAVGFSGLLCETDLNECDSQPCEHGGTCTDRPGNFTCSCQSGFFGSTCQNEDPCNGTYCENGGTCTYYVNDKNITAECECTLEWTGDTCQVQDAEVIPMKQDLPLALIIGVCVGGVILIILIVVIVLLMTARTKRATRGTYSPSRQENVGSRTEFTNQLKVPPLERLI